jgi:hypothetical protein
MNSLLNSAILAMFAGAGGYLGAYLKRKGENLATHEDIDKLVKQVSAVTTATKEIEAKISSDMWDRQKQWELKREVVFEATKRIAFVKDALSHLYAVYQTEKASVNKGHPERLDKKLKVNNEFNEAANGLDQATSLVVLVCGEEVWKLLHVFSSFTRKLAEEITNGQPEAFDCSLTELVAKLDAIAIAMRKEIGVEKSS